MRRSNPEPLLFPMTRYDGPGWKPLYPGDRPWRAREASQRFTVWHVKWHLGIINNLRDRAAYYRCQHSWMSPLRSSM